MPNLAFDHAVLVVDNLDIAVRDYEALGFTVSPGGTHAGGWTHNALVGFADSGYLELIATVQPRHTRLLRTLQQHSALHLLQLDFGLVQQRFMQSVALGEGFHDFALVSTALEVQIDAANKAGLSLVGPLDGARERPDGVQLAWRFGLPPDASLPFLIDDVTPRERRVPSAQRDTHPNGVVGVAGVLFAVRNSETAAAKFSAMLDVEAGQIEMEGADVRTFAITETFTLTLVAPKEEESELAQHIEAHGERPYRLQLWTSSVSRMGAMDVALSHRARIELISER